MRGTIRRSQIKSGLFFIIACMLFLLTGCRIDLGNWKEESFLPKSENERAKEYVDLIFNAARDMDEDIIYDLFSDNVKEELGEDELRSQIKNFMEFYQGEEIENKSGVIEENIGNEYGEKRSMVKILYGVETDNGDYECALTYIARSDQDAGEEGFECMQFAKKETIDNTPGFLWEDYDTYHGVFIFE